MVLPPLLTYVLPVLSATLVSATNISFPNRGYDRHACYRLTLSLLSNATLAHDDDVFFRDAAGLPMSFAENMTLTFDGCSRICGQKQGWYPDIGPRLSMWLFPVMILISNMELCSLDKRRFLTILHLLGDPIDSIWSMLHKMDAWDHCMTMAERYAQDKCKRCQKVVATVFAGFEEVEGERITDETYFRSLLCSRSMDDKFTDWQRCAVRLADGRTDEISRTVLAILLYIFQVVSGFVKEVSGGNTSPPGGRIATGVFLSWLFPTILLSNKIGFFTSRRSSHEIMSDFASRTGDRLILEDRKSVWLPGCGVFARTASTSYFRSLIWSGAVYTFRPWKSRNSFHTKHSRWRYALLLLLSIFPVFIAFVGACTILWHSLPTGLNCRHAWALGIFVAWHLSFLITSLSNHREFATEKYHWRFVPAKDALIAAPSITIFFLSACGWFNSCWCWSGYVWYGSSARVLMNDAPFYLRNGRTVYPIVVGTSLAIQLLVYVVYCAVWRKGLSVIRWREVERAKEYQRVADGTVCDCDISHGVVGRRRRSSILFRHKE